MILRPTDDLRIERIRPLIPPAILMEELPRHGGGVDDRSPRAREAVDRVLRGEDDRLMVVVGPCSIHDVEAALEYARAPRGARRRGWPTTSCS